jgi:segregation and condensation protein B
MNDSTHTDDLTPADDLAETQSSQDETDVDTAAEQPVDASADAPVDAPADSENVAVDDAADSTLQALSGDPASMVEAVLFASDAPLTAAKIADVTALSAAAVKKSIDELNADYDQRKTSFHIKPLAGGFQMQTRPEFDAVLSRLLADRKDSKLSQAAMETLAIIAYRQPILRANIEAIRGVACGEVLRGLMERQMVKIVGRADVLGRPMLYGTTRKFDLPNSEDLRTKAYDPSRDALPEDQPENDQEADQDPDSAPPSGSESKTE